VALARPTSVNAECQAIHGEGHCDFTGHPDGSGELERNY
jgi:hypothetical protein